MVVLFRGKDQCWTRYCYRVVSRQVVMHMRCRVPKKKKKKKKKRPSKKYQVVKITIARARPSSRLTVPSFPWRVGRFPRAEDELKA